MAITRIGNPAIADQRGINFRNIIINGGMDVAQRGTSASGITSSSYNTVDRFQTLLSSLGTWTQTQSTDVPSGQGFAKSLKMDCTTANASPASGAFCIITTKFEGQNVQYLKKGTSSAESTTLSFWVKSNKTGTYVCQLQDVDNTRSISKSYTINSASTWEKKIITFAGDTTGTLDNDNARSLQVYFWLGAGSDYSGGTLNTSWNAEVNADRAAGNVNLADSTSNEWYITGVQLEAGQVASDFEFLPYDVNLNRCLRYYEKIVSGVSAPITVGANYTATDVYSVLTYTVKRTAPSLDQTTGSSYYQHVRRSTTSSFSQFLSNQIFNNRLRLYVTGIGSTTTGTAGWFATINANSYIAVDAEL